jgi:hypothetical protein
MMELGMKYEYRMMVHGLNPQMMGLGIIKQQWRLLQTKQEVCIF